MQLPKPGQWFANGATAIVTILALVVGIVRVREMFLDHGDSSAQPATQTVSNWRELAASGARLGPEHARVTIVEFADFQCPYCRVVSRDLRDLRLWYPYDVAVVYRHFPLHKFAEPAARASECAARVGSFEALHDAFFAAPESIGIKTWARFARDAGIQDTSRLVSCMTDPAIATLVRRDSAQAAALGIRGTPSFIINDQMVQGNPGFDQLLDYVQTALKGKQIARAN